MAIKNYWEHVKQMKKEGWLDTKQMCGNCLETVPFVYKCQQCGVMYCQKIGCHTMTQNKLGKLLCTYCLAKEGE